MTDDTNHIADQNVERLLADAYRPESPDPAFAAKVTAAMHAAAQEGRRAGSTSTTTAVSAVARRSKARRLVNWTVAASLLLAAGAMIGSLFVFQPRGQQEATYLGQGSRAGQPNGVPNGGAGVSPALGAASQGEGAETPTPQNLAGLTARPPLRTPTAEMLHVGQSLETGPQQRRRVTLDDGSILYLNRDTAVTLDAPRHVSLRRGEIFVEVAQLPLSHREMAPFAVRTPDRELVALGTKFDVRVEDQATNLLVAQGKVQVGGVGLPVLAGQQLALAAGATDGPPAVSPAPRLTHLIEWTRDLMAAAQSPLVPGSKYAGGALVAVDPNGQEMQLSLRKYHVDVHIEDGFARTTIDQTYFNHQPWRMEGTFYFPLPPDASLSRLAMYVNGRLMEGGMAEREYAREVFETIMYRQKDPALLEWVDGSTFKMRVFPLEGRQEKRIVLSYTQRLPSLYGRTEYRFPGGHNLPVVDKWSAHARVQGSGFRVQEAEVRGQRSEVRGQGAGGTGGSVPIFARRGY